jgi:hypothetical protein
MALKSMSVAKLKDLRGEVDAAITEKIAARRSELEVQLSELHVMTPTERAERRAAAGQWDSYRRSTVIRTILRRLGPVAVCNHIGCVTHSNPERSSTASS